MADTCYNKEKGRFTFPDTKSPEITKLYVLDSEDKLPGDVKSIGECGKYHIHRGNDIEDESKTILYRIHPHIFSDKQDESKNYRKEHGEFMEAHEEWEKKGAVEVDVVITALNKLLYEPGEHNEYKEIDEFFLWGFGGDSWGGFRKYPMMYARNLDFDGFQKLWRSKVWHGETHKLTNSFFFKTFIENIEFIQKDWKYRDTHIEKSDVRKIYDHIMHKMNDRTWKVVHVQWDLPKDEANKEKSIKFIKSFKSYYEKRMIEDNKIAHHELYFNIQNNEMTFKKKTDHLPLITVMWRTSK